MSHWEQLSRSGGSATENLESPGQCDGLFKQLEQGCSLSSGGDWHEETATAQAVSEPNSWTPTFYMCGSVPANNTEGKTRWSLGSLPAQTILWYSSKHLHNQGQLNSAQRTLCLSTLEPLTPGACWLRQTEKLSAAVSAGMFFNYLWKVWTVYHH